MYADDDAASRPLSYGVSPKPAALKDQRFDPALTFLAPNSSRVRVRGAPKTDLLAPAERRFANFVFAIFRLGANAGARAFAAKLVRPPRRRARAGLSDRPAGAGCWPPSPIPCFWVGGERWSSGDRGVR